MVSNLIKASENSLKNLQNELEGLILSSKGNEQTIDNLSKALKGRDYLAEATSQKYVNTLNCLSKHERTLTEI